MGKPANTKNRRVASMAAGFCIFMLGAAYASVPLYKAFCQATGFAGTTQRAAKAPDAVTDKYVYVRFDANSSGELGWTFRARQTEMKVKVGEQNIAYYDAKNIGAHETTGSAVYNVTPPTVGQYFDKIQCFCFTQHTLKPGEEAEFPVVFFVDPAFVADKGTKGIEEITLSYTFYPVSAAQKQAIAN